MVNSARIACWSLIDLAVHPEWQEKCKKEIQGVISRHLGDAGSYPTTSDKFAALPFEVWEDELPVLEACIRESHRLAFTGTSLRRNVREDMKIGGQNVRRGDFLAYSAGDAHLNPKYYPDPYKYDPGRWLRPDPVPTASYPFLGWGAGRHPCTGMKVAKLEMKLIVAVFLTRFKFELVDKSGKAYGSRPMPDRNDIHRVSPGFGRHVSTLCLSLCRLDLLDHHVTSISRRSPSRWMADR